MSGISHTDRAERRKSIAEYVSLHGVDAAAKHFQVSMTTIYTAAREYGVMARKDHKQHRRAKASQFRVLRMLLDGVSPADIVSELNVSKQRVSQIKYEAIEAGFDLT